MIYFFCFGLKMTSWACLVGSGSTFIFHWKAQLFIIFKSLLRSFADVWVSCTTENKEVSSAKQLYIGSEAFFEIINVNLKQQRTKHGTLRYSSINIFPCRDLSVEDYAGNYCCKELHVTCVSVPESASDKGLS